jgi:NAD-dependent dihydropyrimidine dehydrogenase PreA subunit
MTKKLTIIISEDRNDHSSQKSLQQALLAGLSTGVDVEVSVLPHLYDLVPDGPAMQYLQSIEGHMIVLAWLYPRAIYWLLDANRIRGRMGATSYFPEEELAPPPTGSKGTSETVPDRSIWCIDLRGHAEPESLLAEIERIAQGALGRLTSVAIATGGAEPADNGHTRIEESIRPRWYPVVDYKRCGQCMECLNFCLFGVFAVDETGTLWVEQPDACRDGCPACSRVCPMGAIMFPTHDNPAIAGNPKASADSFRLELVPFFGTTDANAMAATERQRALAKQSPSAKQPTTGQPSSGPTDPKQPSTKRDLDRLVDELDKSDL